MNSTPRRTFRLIRNHPLLLLGPMLASVTFHSIVHGIVSHFNGLYFPRIDSHAMRAMKLAAHVNGGAAVTVYSVALHNMAMRTVITNGDLIFQLILEVFAVALTVALTAQLYLYGTDTFTAAVGRLRTVPRLIGTLLRLTVRLLVVGVAVCLAMVMVSVVPLMLFYKGHVPNAANLITASHGFLLVLSILVFLWTGIVASFVMPYFLDASLQIQRQTPESDTASKLLTTQARRYAWIMAGGIVCLGLLVGCASIALAGTPVLTNIYLHGVEKMIASIIEEIPIIAFVVATTLLVAHVNESYTDSVIERL